MRLFVFGAVLLVAVSRFAACSSFSEGEDANDAGSDAALDSGLDASPSQDAGSDAPSADASVATAYGAAVLLDHPFVYWRMDDIDGGMVMDSSDGGPLTTLILTGIVNTTPGVTGEASDHGVYFGASGGGSALFDRLSALDTTFTFECWVQTSNVAEYSTIFSRFVIAPAPPTQRLGLLGYLTNGSPTGERDNGSDASFVHGLPEASIVDKAYHHVVITRDAPGTTGATFTLYVDTVQNDQVGSDFATPVPPQTRLYLAGDSEMTYLKGALDEVAIYDYALPLDRIVAHYRIVHPVP